MGEGRIPLGPWAMGVPGRSAYGLEGGLCCRARGVVIEGWKLWSWWFTHCYWTSPGAHLQHLCLTSWVSSIYQYETMLGGRSSGMRSRGTGATGSLGTSFGTLWPWQPLVPLPWAPGQHTSFFLTKEQSHAQMNEFSWKDVASALSVANMILGLLSIFCSFCK